MNKLQEACIISHEHWIENIDKSLDPDLKIPSIKIPRKENKIIDIKDLEGKSKKKFIKSQVVRIILIASVLFALLMSVCAFSPFKDFIVDFFENYNLFTNDDYEMHFPKSFNITNLPEEFTLINEYISINSIVQEYQYGEKSFIAGKYTPDTFFQVSNEYLETIVFYDNGVKYSLFRLTDSCTEVIWLTDEYSYDLTGFNMSNEELIEIAKNIK